MAMRRLLSTILFFLAVTGVSDASLRVLMADEKVSPSPTPVSPPISGPSPKLAPKPEKSKEKSPSNDDKSHKKSPNVPPTTDDPSGSTKDPKGQKSGENGGKDDGKKGSKGGSGSGNHEDKVQEETCDKSLASCHDADLVACLRHPNNDSKKLNLLVQNAGENTLGVNITASASVTIDVTKLNLTKHSAKKINVSSDDNSNLKIVLKAGKGECVLQIIPSVSDWNPFQQFPAYATRLTPMYGAYFLFFTLVIAGGAWACCKFGRRGRRNDNGVPYQQLEMGVQPRSNSAVIETTTADAWDQGWDDGWDEEEATARPSNKSPNANGSSNGLTSRSANKNNGWDDDWDD